MNEEEINNEYDLFISHYQYNGGQLALNIKLLLEKKNPEFKIFLDVDSNMENIHNLENFIKKSKNILLLITEGVFDRYFVLLELKTALNYNKNIITLWDKDRCPIFPKKENIKDDLVSILDIKAINWIPELKYRNLVIEDIIEKMEINPKNKCDNNQLQSHVSSWLSDMYSCSSNDSTIALSSSSNDYIKSSLSSTNYSSHILNSKEAEEIIKKTPIPENKNLTINSIQTRKPWTQIEDELLKKGYLQGLNWAMISAAYLQHRSRGDCWGRFKTLKSRNLVY